MEHLNLLNVISVMDSEISFRKTQQDKELTKIMNTLRDLRTFCKPCSECEDNVNPKNDCFICHGLGWVADEKSSISFDIISPVLIELSKLKNDIETRYNAEIDYIVQAQNILRKHNEMCEICDGTGKKAKPRANSYCDREFETCSFCKGTGVALKRY